MTPMNVDLRIVSDESGASASEVVNMNYFLLILF